MRPEPIRFRACFLSGVAHGRAIAGTSSSRAAQATIEGRAPLPGLRRPRHSSGSHSARPHRAAHPWWQRRRQQHPLPLRRLPSGPHGRAVRPSQDGCDRPRWLAHRLSPRGAGRNSGPCGVETAPGPNFTHPRVRDRGSNQKKWRNSADVIFGNPVFCHVLQINDFGRTGHPIAPRAALIPKGTP